MPDEYASVATDDGFEVSSNSESRAEMQEILEVTPEEKPPSTKPPASDAKSPQTAEPEKVSAVDRDEKGQFKAKPIPDKEAEDAKAADPAERPPEKDQKAVGEAKEEVGEEAKPEKKGRPDARQRVEQATRESAEAKRIAAAAVRENQALRQALEARKEAAPKAGAPTNEKPGAEWPVLAEGGDPTDFVRKTAAHASMMAQRGADQQRQARERTSEFERQVSSVNERFSDAWQEREKREPGFKDRIRQELYDAVPTFHLQPGERPTVMNALAAEVMSASNPIDVLIHISENEDEFQRIATLSPRELTRTIAKIEGKLEAATAGTPAPVIPPFKPSAAEPVTPVTGAATAATGPPDAEDTSEAGLKRWMDYHNEKDRKRRRA